MSLYRHKLSGDVKEIADDQYARWVADKNPKADAYEPYTPPPPEPPGPPEQVTKRQWRLWRRFQHGIVDPDAEVHAAIDQYVPEQMREYAHMEYDSTYYIKFTNPLVPLLAQVLGIADVDSAFREMEEKYG